MSENKFDGGLDAPALELLGHEIKSAIKAPRSVWVSHVADNLLLRYLQGEESPTISAHLETCEKCAACAARLAAEPSTGIRGRKTVVVSSAGRTEAERIRGPLAAQPLIEEPRKLSLPSSKREELDDGKKFEV